MSPYAAIPLLLCLAACTLGPDYQRPPDNVPAQFGTTIPGTEPVAATAPWWEAFHDPILTQIITHARDGNPDVQRAQATVREARAAVAQARNGVLPQLSATGSGQIARQYTPPDYYTPTYSYGTTGFDASWELDLWGKGRRSIEAAQANAEGAEANADDAMLTLLGEIGREYAALRGQQAQLGAVRAAIVNQQHNVAMVRLKQQLGDGSDLEVVQAETDLAQSLAEIPPLQSAIMVSIHALAILSGDSPDTLVAQLTQPAPVPRAALPETSIPADLIRRRPDVRAAERLLAANTAQVGAAIAARYPSLSLSGSLSFSGTSIASLLATPLFAAGPSVSIPILDANRNAAAVDIARARVDEARAGYRKAVLVALQDVEDAMANLTGERLHRRRLAETVRLSERGVFVAHEVYQIGATDFLTILTAQRSLDQARTALAQSDAAVMTDQVALFKALGGGYAAPTKQTPAE